MPRVTHVKAARKDNPVCKAGESYYWWKFRYGGKRYSLTYPKPSQLTQSAYFGALYDLIDMINGHAIEPGDDDAVESLKDDVYSSIEEIQSECQDSLDNMPESLQYAPTGELLQERIDACDSAMSDLDSVEAPSQWDEERERAEEREAWEEREPQAEEFELDEDGEDTEFKDAKLAWLDEEPDELEGFDDFETHDLTEAVENCMQ